MRLRKVAFWGVGALGAAAVGNAFLERRAGELEPPLAGDQRTYRWRGMDVAYTEAGDRADDTVLFLHGVDAAATSREFREIVATLATEYHVVVPDLPGFGRSDRPRIDYDADLYVDFVREFAHDLAPEATCVAASLTGSYAALAQRESGVFSRLVLVTPTATTGSFRRPLLKRILRSPVVGTTAFNVIASRASIRYFTADHGLSDPRRRSASDIEYRWRSAHRPGARYAPASFVSGFLDPDAHLGDVLATLDVPITLIWGRDAEMTPLSYGRDLAESADAKLVVFDRARLSPHVEYPERFRDVLETELAGETEPGRVD